MDNKGHIADLVNGAWIHRSKRKVVQITASRGVVWSRGADGAVGRYESGNWRRIRGANVDAAYACNGTPLLRRGEELLIIDNTQPSVASGVRDVACYDDHVWVLLGDGQLLDVTSGMVIDSGPDTVSIWAIHDGLLTRTAADELRLYTPGDRRWVRVVAPR